MLDEGEVELTPERMEIIKTELGHLRRLVGDLTTLTQVEAHELEIEMLSVLPSVFLEQIYRTYQPIAARQGADLVLSLSERAPLIRPDESRMLQVL